MLREKLEKCGRDFLCKSCGCCMSFSGFSADQTLCLDCIEFKKADDIAKANGIKYSHWDFDADTDFSAPHNFQGAKWMIGSNTYCCENPGHRTKIMGNTWMDIWKAADRLCKNKVCNHRFVEMLSSDGYTVKVHFGS